MRGDVLVELAPGWHFERQDGTGIYGPGDRLEMDADQAAHWVHRGWAVPVVTERAA